MVYGMIWAREGTNTQTDYCNYRSFYDHLVMCPTKVRFVAVSSALFFLHIVSILNFFFKFDFI